jgi:hypothetical protein
MREGHTHQELLLDLLVTGSDHRCLLPGLATTAGYKASSCDCLLPSLAWTMHQDHTPKDPDTHVQGSVPLRRLSTAGQPLLHNSMSTINW